MDVVTSSTYDLIEMSIETRSPKLLSGLSEEQLNAVVDPSLRLCIIAGAGSGKTRVMAARIAHRVENGIVPSPRVVAITFTRNAAQELRDRLNRSLDGEQIECATFHSFALSVLKNWSDDRQVRPPKVTDSKLGLLKAATLDLIRSGKVPHSHGSYRSLRAIAAEIEWARAVDLDPENYMTSAAAAVRLNSTTSFNPKSAPKIELLSVALIYAEYQRLKRRSGLYDLDDLIEETSRLLESDYRFRSAFNWLHREIYVDEFQDINPAQLRLLKAMTSDQAALCVVGDPRQSIFAWNGSDPSLILNFHAHFPNSKVVELTTNYRSTPEILQAAGTLDLGSASKLQQVVAFRSGGSYPRTTEYQTDADEAEMVAKRIRDLVSAGSPPSSIAVLARTNSQLVPIADQLSSHGVGHNSPNSSNLSEMEEVITIVSILNSRDPELSISDACDELEAGISHDPNSGDTLLSNPGKFVKSKWDSSLELVLALAHSVRRADPNGNISQLSDRIYNSVDHFNTRNSVSLCSFHKAKGLEWSTVFVVGLEEGSVPHYQSTTPDRLEEEARLMYVAMTRARNNLELSYCKQRRFGQSLLERTQSRYLAPLRLKTQVPAAVTATNSIGTTFGQMAIRQARTTLDGPSNTESLIKVRLETWRRQRSTLLGLSPQTLLSDSSIRLLVEQPPEHPDSIEQLIGDRSWLATVLAEELISLILQARSS